MLTYGLQVEHHIGQARRAREASQLGGGPTDGEVAVTTGMNMYITGKENAATGSSLPPAGVTGLKLGAMKAADSSSGNSPGSPNAGKNTARTVPVVGGSKLSELQ